MLRKTEYPLLFGVVGGIANALGVGVTFLRIVIFCLFLFTGFFPVGLIYLLLALLMPR